MSRWRYDALGRVVAAIAPDGVVDSTHYDPAGNPDLLVTRRGLTIAMTYDALGRLRSRVVQGVTYQAETIGIASVAYWFPQGPYPRIPNPGAGSAYVIATRADSFAYALNGEIASATNQDARVTRTYWPNRQLKDEILEVRNADAASTAP